MIQLNFANCVLRSIALHTIDMGEILLAKEFLPKPEENEAQIILRTITGGMNRTTDVRKVTEYSVWEWIQKGDYYINTTYDVATHIKNNLHGDGIIVIAKLSEVFVKVDDNEFYTPAVLVAYVTNHDYAADFHEQTINIARYNKELDTAVLLCGEIAFVVKKSSSKSLQIGWEAALGMEPYMFSFSQTKKFTQNLKNVDIKDIKATEPDIMPKMKLYLQENDNGTVEIKDWLDDNFPAEIAQELTNRMEANDVPLTFEVDKAALANTPIFRSIMKLDKNFHVYVHGGKENMETGYDEERKMSYLKLFYYNSL